MAELAFVWLRPAAYCVVFVLIAASSWPSSRVFAVHNLEDFLNRVCSRVNLSADQIFGEDETHGYVEDLPGNIQRDRTPQDC